MQLIKFSVLLHIPTSHLKSIFYIYIYIYAGNLSLYIDMIADELLMALQSLGLTLIENGILKRCSVLHKQAK